MNEILVINYEHFSSVRSFAPAFGIINGVLVWTIISLKANATDEETGPTNISTLSEEINFLLFST